MTQEWVVIYNGLANGYGAAGALAVDSSGNLVLFQISAYLQVMYPEIIDLLLWPKVAPQNLLRWRLPPNL